uniref:Uncharacterized protein n=1 Tax=Romanomermis culicivorax TaxID=13658 RepID=A0A915IWZ7_ROMCU
MNSFILINGQYDDRIVNKYGCYSGISSQKSTTSAEEILRVERKNYSTSTLAKPILDCSIRDCILSETVKTIVR